MLSEERLRRVLARMLDENEFLSPFGIRSLSRHHLEHPYVLAAGDQRYKIGYLPAESDSGVFGGNSNWRGPVWLPVNTLLVRALLHYYAYYGPNFTVEFPTGSGHRATLYEIARGDHRASGAHLHGRQPRAAAGLRRRAEVPDDPPLARSPAVLRILPRRQRRRHRRQPPDRLDRADRVAASLLRDGVINGCSEPLDAEIGVRGGFARMATPEAGRGRASDLRRKS